MTIQQISFAIEIPVSCYIDTNKGSKANDLPSISKDATDKIYNGIRYGIDQMRKNIGVLGFDIKDANVTYKQAYSNVSKNKLPKGAAILDSDLIIDDTINEPLLLTLSEALEFIRTRPNFKIVLDTNELTSEDSRKTVEVVLK